MRRFLPYILGLTVVILLGLLLLPGWPGSSSLPGTDLSRFHPRAVPAHVEALKAADKVRSGERPGASRPVTGPAGPGGQVRVLRGGNPREVVRLSYEALARKAVPLLTAALGDADARVRAAAAAALAETGPLAEPA